MDDNFQDEAIYEVEDLLEYKPIDGKDFFLVKWKGYSETSWEPDENIGNELAELKEAARRGGGDKKRKHDKADRKDKKDKEKKEKKKRRRDSSEEKRRKDSESESSQDDEKMPPMPHGMMGMPGMMPGVPGMPMPGMVPGFSPDMPMMPGMMPGMMLPPDLMGKGKGMGPMPHMMKGKCAGKGPMVTAMGHWPFEPGKGMPRPMKGKGKGFAPGFRPFPEMNPVGREALDTQRFSVERKRRLREVAGSLHSRLAKDVSVIDPEKAKHTADFQSALNLQLEDNQLPVMASSETVAVDALWLLYLHDAAQGDEERELLVNLARLIRAKNSRARQLLIRAFHGIWPHANATPSGSAIRLLEDLAPGLPRLQGGPETDTSMSGNTSPEYWRELITSIYKEYNPLKLDDVDALLTKYRGRERTLYLGICDKYKVPPTFEMGGARPRETVPAPSAVPATVPQDSTAGTTQADSADASMNAGSGDAEGERASGAPLGAKIEPDVAAEEQAAHYRALICKVYSEHNPSKLDDVDKLLSKYRGREEHLYKKVCDKYKVAQIPKKVEEDTAVSPHVAKYKQLISEIYAEKNPEKLQEIDDIMQKYSGKEKTLYLAVCSKYQIEPKVPQYRQKADAMDAPSEEIKLIRPLICEIYTQHNPAKLDDVDQLLAKYKGREELLYHGICEKYKVEPKLPKPANLSDAGLAADALGGTSGSDALRQAFSDLIKEAYREHNPLKLDQVDRLLEKYMGQEQDLYLTICRKYSIKPKDPEGLGDLEWLNSAEETLPRILQRLVTVLVLHNAGLTPEEARQLRSWEDVRPRSPPVKLTHCHDLNGLAQTQLEQLWQELHGDGDARWQRLLERCTGVDIKGPSIDIDVDDQTNSRCLILTDNSKGRATFEASVSHVRDALAHAVRSCAESEPVKHRWQIPWSSTEVRYINSHATGDSNGIAGEQEQQDVGVEYRRGCWTPKKHMPVHSHSLHHSLCGPSVEGRLPEMWRDLADSLWAGILSLVWGDTMPAEVFVTVEATRGWRAEPPRKGVPSYTSAGPSASVTITAASEEELEQAKRLVTPVLTQVLRDLQVDGLFVPTSVFTPQQRHAPRIGRERSSSRSLSSSSGDEINSEGCISDAEPTENYRPIRLSRAKVRDAYLQGLLCLNCDAADHKHQECPYRKKVCWNCHGNHAGNECPIRCRFCKDRHDFPLLECVKRVCRRVNDWKKSKPAQEQRGVLSSFEQLIIKLEGFEDITLAKHNQEVQLLVKSLAEQHALFPGEIHDLAMSILNMQPPAKQARTEPVTPPPPPGPPPKPYATPKLPKEPPPAMPENKYPWSEKIFLDTLLTRGMYGSNILSRIIGRGGVHHRRMESESGARVFFRGLGVSGRDMELVEPIDCRLHISVKGEVPLQGQVVRRIIKEIFTELENEIAEKGETGPALDRVRDPELHPFSFLLPKETTPGQVEPMKFRFPEEDGHTLNDILVWLKQAKLPLELDSDTQWRTSLQITPAEPPLPDDAPQGADEIVKVFNSLVSGWHHPSPYWFEEHDLVPTGIWTPLTAHDGEVEAGPISLQQGQSVRLSSKAADVLATLLESSEMVPMSHATIFDVLHRLRGVIRQQAEDEKLLLYLSYSWAWHTDALGRGLKLPFGRDQVHKMLVQLGRVGARPTEACATPPFRGFIVEWFPLRPGAPGAVQQPPRSLVQHTRPALPALTQPPQRQMPALPAPLPMMPAPMMQPLQMPQMTAAKYPPPAGAPGVVPSTSAVPRGFCKYWLPEQVFATKQDIKELIAGPGGAHFMHVLKKYPAVELKIDGQCSTAAPPAHRLHVCMSSEDSEVFEYAAADVLDLVETVCDMVGEELGMNEDEAERLTRLIRAEKYFEANGARTPLPPSRSRQPEVVAQQSQAAPPPIVDSSRTAHGVAPSPSVPQPGKHEATTDFEFVDEDVDHEPHIDHQDDDACTEASDMLSDITDDERRGRKPAFDDI